TLMTSNDKPGETKKSKEGYGFIILSGVFIAAGFIGSYGAFPSLWSTLLYAAAIIISDYKPVISAYFSVNARSLDINVIMSVAAFCVDRIVECVEVIIVV